MNTSTVGRASVYPEKNWKLLSTSIVEREDGRYPFYERILLTFLEPMRREIIRTNRAVANFSPLESPWQAYYVHVWFTEYFIPFVILFQQAQDRFIVPHYNRLNWEFPEMINNEDTYVYATCDRLLSLTKEIYSLIKVQEGNQGQVKDKVNALLTDFRALVPEFTDHLMEYYNLLERFTPAMYQATGEKEYSKVEVRLSTFFLTKHQKICTLITPAMYSGWGVDFPKYPRPNVIEDTPWCSERTRNEAMANISYLLVDRLVSSWNDRYQRMRLRINSVYEEIDHLHETEDDRHKYCCNIT